MTTYTNVFGGETLPPSEYAFRAISLTADLTLHWPDNTDGTDLIASLMNITPNQAGWTITLPAANEVGTGRDFVIRNLGAHSFDVVDNAAGALATIAAGESRYFYITANGTAAGSWSVFTYGTGSSAADASALVGYGLTVLSGTLNSDLPISGIATAYTLSAVDRAQFLVYQGGSGTWTIPDHTSLPNGFWCAINNAGTGTLTLDAGSSGTTIDESNTKSLQPGESLILSNSAAAQGWYSVGYGRSSEFAFTQLAVDVSALSGTLTITSAQAANKLWYFYNTATGDNTITIPAVASVYFIRVGAIGAGNDLVFTTGSGSTVTISPNQSYTIYCDGTNVVSAQTVAVASTVALDDGSASTPSLNFSLDADTGIYRSTTNVLGISAAGSMVATFGAAGMTLATDLAVTEGGTGRSSSTAYALIAGGTSGTGAQQSLTVGATTEILVGGGAAAVPVWTTATGSGAPVRATSPTLVTPVLGTPASGTLTNCTGLPITTGLTGATTGTGDLVFATSPTLVTPALGTPASGTLTNATGLPLSTGVTGTLPIANGGTGQTGQTAAFDALAPTTTKGDLIAHNGTDNIRVAIGTDGRVLAADSTAASGIAWKDAASIGTLTLPVSLAEGGTSATDAATARTNLGLGNVDNTSDANKPVSSATQTALNLKQDTLVSGTNIKTVNGTSLLGSGDVPFSVNLRSVSGADTVVAGDKGDLIDCSGTFSLAITAAATLGDGFYFYVKNSGTGVITIDPNSSETIDGVATIKVYPGESFLVQTNGTAFKTSGRQRLVLIGTSTVSSSVSTVDFETGFDDTEFDEIIVRGYGVAHNGAAARLPRLRLKLAGAYATTNYVYQAIDSASSTTASYDQGATAVALQMTSTTVAVADKFSMEARVQNISTATNQEHVVDWVCHALGGRLGQGRGGNSGGSAVQGLRLLMSADSISAGTFNVYGMRKS